MTKHEANVGLAAIITTVAEVGEAPEGIMYAALMGAYNLDDFTALLSICKRAGLLADAGMHLVKITDAGRDVARKIEAHAARARA